MFFYLLVKHYGNTESIRQLAGIFAFVIFDKWAKFHASEAFYQKKGLEASELPLNSARIKHYGPPIQTPYVSLARRATV